MNSSRPTVIVGAGFVGLFTNGTNGTKITANPNGTKKRDNR
ncbi:MAG: hypothetical protein RMY64_11705 [Nostoc sp. DedQUE08]|nr:hypothetical protein [Nostoc sp. DedQUE08]